MTYKELHNELRNWIQIRNTLSVDSPKFKEAQEKITDLSWELKRIASEISIKSDGGVGNYKGFLEDEP